MDVTSAEQFRSAITHPASREVSIAGVPWPAYKLFALLTGLVVLALVGIVTASAEPAVLAGAAAATVMWIGFGLSRHPHDH